MPRQSFVSLRQLRRKFDDGRPSAEGHPRWHNQPGSNPSYSDAICLAQRTARSHAARNAVRYFRNHSLDGAPLFSKLDSNKLRLNVKNEMTLICAKFDANLINISKVTSRKTKWPRFFGLPGRHKSHGSNFGRMPFLLPPMTYKQLELKPGSLASSPSP